MSVATERKPGKTQLLSPVGNWLAEQYTCESSF